VCKCTLLCLLAADVLGAAAPAQIPSGENLVKCSEEDSISLKFYVILPESTKIPYHFLLQIVGCLLCILQKNSTQFKVEIMAAF
jgi:hypothetical protein